jgi:hypothetical protein
MPIHPHHSAERLKPKRLRQAREKFVPAIVMDDRLSDDRAKAGHATCQPWRNMAAM